VTQERDLEFAQTMRARPAIFTKIILGLNILIFLVMTLAGGTTNELTLLAFGVKSNPHIDAGEVWRFVTPIFIHIGLLHLFFNSYALWMVGAQVEKLYGGSRFLLLYLLTGIAGVVASYWYSPGNLSAGASGAIFGLFGVLLVFGYKYKDSIPPFFQRAVGSGVLPVIVINLIIGFTIPAIDNAAHIGGLIAGALLASVVSFERPGSLPDPTMKFVQSVVILVVAASFYPVVTNYEGPSISFRNLSGGWSQMTGTQSSVDEFLNTINNTQRVFTRSADALSEATPDEIKQLEADTEASIDLLSDIPSIAAEPDRIISAGLLEVMQNQYALLQDIERSGAMTFGHNDRARQNVRRFTTLMEDLNSWVQREGSEYGIVLRRP
jgi:membrane associated rhomboid family serine protease